MQPLSVESERFSKDEIRRELDCILSSETFRRSERQSKFLRFVCELTISGDAARINEYLIAHEVFGRGPDYSPGEDSVVRRQAHGLRQKLQDYYAGEGKPHRMRIDLPVGRYVPVFARQNTLNAVIVADTPAPAAQPAVKAVPSSAARWRIVSLVIGAVVLLGGGWLIGQWTPTSPRRTPLPAVIAELWGEWLHDPAGAWICFSNPVTAVVKQFPHPMPSDAIPHRIRMGPDEEKQFREALDLPAGGYLYLSPALSQAKMGEALGAVGITSLFARSGVPIRASQSRFLNWNNFRTQNLILLGHDEANRWVDPLMEHLPFRLAATEVDKQRRIINRSPRGQELSEYHIEYASAKNEPRQDYALITMMRGIDGRHRLLLINGLNTEGTQAACEFLTNTRNVEELISKFRSVAPKNHGPWNFQVVLKTEVHDVVPIKASLLAFRVL